MFTWCRVMSKQEVMTELRYRYAYATTVRAHLSPVRWVLSEDCWSPWSYSLSFHRKEVALAWAEAVYDLKMGVPYTLGTVEWVDISMDGFVEENLVYDVLLDALSEFPSVRMVTLTGWLRGDSIDAVHIIREGLSRLLRSRPEVRVRLFVEPSDPRYPILAALSQRNEGRLTFWDEEWD